MSLYNLCTLFVGGLMPVLVALLMKESWSTQVKTWVAVAICTCAATLFAFLNGKLDSQDWLQSIINVNGASILLFTTFWKPSGFTNPLEALNFNLLTILGVAHGSAVMPASQPSDADPDVPADPAPANLSAPVASSPATHTSTDA